MVTNEFVHAAKRHLTTCKELLAVANTAIPADKKNHILDNIYYLSGYVLETMLSYVLCNKMNLQGDVMDTDYFKTTAFKTHNLNTKIMYLKSHDCNINGVVFISTRVSREQQKMFSSWGADYRYQKSGSLRQNVDINEYMKNIQVFYNQILQKYPMV